jgi:hypothetical protein
MLAISFELEAVGVQLHILLMGVMDLKMVPVLQAL